MRLLKLNADGGFTLITFHGNSIPKYGILSRTWEVNDKEITFQDLIRGVGSSKAGC
jgi:hypothetical protein